MFNQQKSVLLYCATNADAKHLPGSMSPCTVMILRNVAIFTKFMILKLLYIITINGGKSIPVGEIVSGNHHGCGSILYGSQNVAIETAHGQLNKIFIWMQIVHLKLTPGYTGMKKTHKNHLLMKICEYMCIWHHLQNQFGPDQILIGPRSKPNLVM